jgi:hypothetical protein
MGPAVTHPWRLQFVIKVSARSYLHTTCTLGTLLHPTCTYGIYSYSYVTLVIHHKSLHSILSLFDVYLWDPSASDLWDSTAYMSCVPVGPFSISIRPVRPDGLRVTGTYGTQQLTCHMYLWNLSPSPSNLWDAIACVSLVPFVPPGSNKLKKKP